MQMYRSQWGCASGSRDVAKPWYNNNRLIHMYIANIGTMYVHRTRVHSTSMYNVYLVQVHNSSTHTKL